MVFTRDKAFYKRFFSMLIIIALQNLVVSAVNLTGNVMIGGYSEIGLSAVALANQFIVLLQMFSVGIGDGIIVLASQYWGQKSLKTIRRIYSIGIWIGVASGLIFFLLSFCMPELCLKMFTNDAALIEAGAEYIRIVSFTCLPFALMNILLACLRSIETVRIGFITSSISLVISIVLNYALIYGKFGAPEMGIKGSAIATLTARVVEFAIIAGYLLLGDKKIRMKIKDLLYFDKELFRDFIRTGMPVILTNALWGVAMAVQTAILGRMSGSVVAANSIAATVSQLLTVLAFSPASASAVLMGKTIGENRIEDAKQYSKTLQVLYLMIGVLSSLMIFFSKDIVMGFYNVSEETAQLANQFIIVMAVIVIGSAYQVPVANGIVRGSGDTKYSFVVDMLFMWVLVIPSALLAAFVFELSPVIVFICLKSDNFLKCIPAFFKVNFFHKIKQLTR